MCPIPTSRPRNRRTRERIAAYTFQLTLSRSLPLSNGILCFDCRFVFAVRSSSSKLNTDLYAFLCVLVLVQLQQLFGGGGVFISVCPTGAHNRNQINMIRTFWFLYCLRRSLSFHTSARYHAMNANQNEIYCLFYHSKSERKWGEFAEMNMEPKIGKVSRTQFVEHLGRHSFRFWYWGMRRLRMNATNYSRSLKYADVNVEVVLSFIRCGGNTSKCLNDICVKWTLNIFWTIDAKHIDSASVYERVFIFRRDSNRRNPIL